MLHREQILLMLLAVAAAQAADVRRPPRPTNTAIPFAHVGVHPHR